MSYLPTLNWAMVIASEMPRPVPQTTQARRFATATRGLSASLHRAGRWPDSSWPFHGSVATMGWPLAARTQQGERMRRIGVLMAQAADARTGNPRLHLSYHASESRMDRESKCE
jgi:hypothetical protein